MGVWVGGGGGGWLGMGGGGVEVGGWRWGVACGGVSRGESPKDKKIVQTAPRHPRARTKGA